MKSTYTGRPTRTVIRLAYDRGYIAGYAQALKDMQEARRRTKGVRNE